MYSSYIHVYLFLYIIFIYIFWKISLIFQFLRKMNIFEKFSKKCLLLYSFWSFSKMLKKFKNAIFDIFWKNISKITVFENFENLEILFINMNKYYILYIKEGIHIYIQTYTYICMCIYTYINRYVYVCISKYVYMYITIYKFSIFYTKN